MARNNDKTEGLIGLYNERPIPTSITIPFRYIDYVKRVIALEGGGSFTTVIREMLVERYGCPIDLNDEERIILEIEKRVFEERIRKNKAAERMRRGEENYAEFIAAENAAENDD